MPNKHDVNTYMAIRWYMNVIENLAIETNAGYPSSKDDIMLVLKGAALSLRMLSKGPETSSVANGPSRTAGNREAASASGISQVRAVESGGIEPDNDCPWQTCEDGSCRPSCEFGPKP